MIDIKKIIKILLFIICIIIFIISTYFIIQKYIEDNENQKANDELAEKVITNIESNEETSKIDWNTLTAINEDIVGWIEIPNTNINYPILLDRNLYYLNHNFKKEYNKNGSIFLRDDSLFDNTEITIYGHNMKNGTMFSKIAKYMNKEYFEKNSKIYIYTKECMYEGNIFAIYSKNVNDENEIVKNLDFQEKIKYYQKQSVYYKEIDYEIKKIIKLVTCSYINATTNPTEQRYFLIAEIVEN